MLPPMLIITLLMSLEGGAADVRLLPVRGVGLEKATLEGARARVLDELGLMGLAVEQSEKSAKADCFSDPSCAGPLSGPTAGVIDIELVRFGPDLIITARFFDRSGEEKASAERTVLTEGFQVSGTLLGAEFATAMREAVDNAPDPLLDVEHGASGTPELETEAGASSTSAQESESGVPTLALGLAGGGAAILAIGVLSGAGGGVLYGLAQTTLYNPTALTADKDNAETQRLVGAALSVVGLVVILGGLGVAGSSAAFFF